MKKQMMWLSIVLLLLNGTSVAGEMRVEPATKEVTLRGYTRSIKTATLSSEVSGKITEIHYAVGDTILQKPFANIDTTFIDFDVQSTKVALSKINTQLQKIQSRVSYLEKEFKRKESLFAKGRTTEVIRDAASQELEQARLEEEAVLQEQRSLEIQYKRLRERRERHAVTGPRQWIVTKKMVEVGETVQPGMPLAVVQDFRKLVVPLAVSNDELSGIRKKGERFAASLEDQNVAASIYYVNPEFNERTRKIEIKLFIHNYTGPHRGGLRFVLPVTAESRGLKIPTAALMNRYNNPKVFVKGEKDAVPVTILDTSGHDVTITMDSRLPVGTLLTDPKGR